MEGTRPQCIGGRGAGHRKGKPGQDCSRECPESQRHVRHRRVGLGRSAGHTSTRRLSPTAVTSVNTQKLAGMSEVRRARGSVM